MHSARHIPLSSRLSLILSIALAACGGDSTAPEDTTRNLAKQAGDNQTARVGLAVASAPSVKVTNAAGAGVAGVAITFAVASGSGTVTGANQTTDNTGVATVGGWTLGTTAGPNSLTATVTGGASVTFTATGQAGAAASATKQAGDNQTVLARAAVAVKPSVKVVDQFGNAVQGVSVAFTVSAGGGIVTGGTQVSGVDGIATVGNWTLGPTAGANRLNAAVTGVATPLSFSATAQEVVLQPGQDTTLQAGTIQLTRFVIAAGRTVTVAGNLTINADSSVQIAGTLRGNCVAIVINGEEGVTVTGTIDNACTTQPDTPPRLSVVAKRGFDLRTATIRTTGDVDITNDPTLTDADFLPGASQASRAMAAHAAADVLCGVNSISAPAAQNGSNGKDGTNGRNGRTWTMQCRGDLSIGGTVAGQDAGNGGNGTDTQAGAASASGGNGGNGGNLKVKATGIIALGAGAVLRSGRGGDGGTATATAQQSDAGTKAPSATATGGSGGEPGDVEVRGKNGIQVSSGAQVEVGRGGHGGDATATGADGKEATAIKAAQDGGNATTTAGRGGTVAVGKLNASGNLLGGPAVTGGNGGWGGDAFPTAGKGGDSQIEAFPAGGNGGSLSGTGGTGGNAQARNLAGSPVGTGGDGGSASFQRGNGGTGWNDCGTPQKPGGKGGNGGSATGGDGAAGTGATNGTAGGVFYTDVGNGGAGGNGAGPGTGGTGGSEAGVTVRKGPAVRSGKTFQAGPNGLGCVAPGKGVLRFSASGIPTPLLPTVFGLIKSGNTVVAQVTAASQELQLNVGTYTFEPTIVDPNGYRYLLASCTASATVNSSREPMAVDGDPCSFTIAEQQLLNLAMLWVATRAQLSLLGASLPPQSLAQLVLTACTAPGVCNGQSATGVVPGAVFLTPGLWRLVLTQYLITVGLLQQTYAGVATPLEIALVAGQLTNRVLAYYLLYSSSFFGASMVVGLDQHGHSPFILMWAAAVLQMRRQYPPPQQGDSGSTSLRDDVPVPITITGPAPFVTVTGTLNPDGSIVATGSGTVAGRTNVPVRFTGTLAANGSISGQYRMGQDVAPTGLPNGSITYNVSGAPVAPPQAASVKR